MKSDLLVHYDLGKPIKLSCDALPYGVGACLSHVMEDGTERPVAFASQTLAPAEKNYAHLEKEALALIYGIRHFHKYLMGRKFTLATNHRPLLRILGAKEGVPTLAAARLQRWALILSVYSYELEYRAGQDNKEADVLSRLPIPVEVIDPNEQIFGVDYCEPFIAHDCQRDCKGNPIECGDQESISIYSIRMDYQRCGPILTTIC